jgi:enoyl-CoA hydratase/carnithine racemase
MDVHVLVERKDGVLSILLARPERRNAITVAMYAALADAIESAADNNSIRLITIEGQGEDFTSGNDLGDFLKELPQPGSGEDLPVWRLLRALAKNQVPIIAAVHGNAVGIGTTMLFHCDFVLAEEGCRFVMPFVDLGLVPEAASSLIFPGIAGRRNAARHLLLGEPFGALEARDMGLASHVVGKGQLKQALLRREDTQAVLERMELENGHFAERLQSDEVKSAIAAFFSARVKA